MKSAAVIGLGTMGAGIAATLARGGLEVRAFDIDPQAVEKARAALPAIAGVLESLGTPARGDATAVTFAGSLAEAVAGCGLVIENVPENLDLKKSVLAEIDKLAESDSIIASDTSGIPITKLQDGISHPGRVAGMHWSNPPHIIPMIEVIAGAGTDPATCQALVDLIRGLGLHPVQIKKDVPGFVENRVLYAIMREAIDLVEEGVIDPEALDTCVSWGIGYKLSIVGPMRLLDMAGLDIYQAVAGYLNAQLSDRKDVSAMIAARTGEGKLGIKSGEGLFSYRDQNLAELQAERTRRFVAVRRALEQSDRS
ncbi:MAG: 3-hydroxyacyl-CoA dehydrogenase NAD-binding domain-containing protein [Kiloniellaceae bacterium]